MEKIIAVLKNLEIDITNVRRTNYIIEEDYLYAELVLRASEKIVRIAVAFQLL